MNLFQNSDIRPMADGVPKAITIDFQTLEDNTVTVRDRDTTQQKRIKINELTN